MTTPLDNHALNACLARVIGKKLASSARGDYWLIVDEDENELIEWDPLHNANQMELVEAWLTRNGWCISIDIYSYDSIAVCATVYKIRGNDNLPQYYKAVNPDKKRALALSIQEMMKCDNIRKTATLVS